MSPVMALTVICLMFTMYACNNKKTFRWILCCRLKTPATWSATLPSLDRGVLCSGATCLLHSRACKSRHNSRLVILQGSSLLIFSHAVREGIDKCERRRWIKRSNERSRQEEARVPRRRRLLLWAPSKEKKRCICLQEGSCRMPALLVSQAVGSIPEFPAAYSFSVINGSKFCACCESRRARAAVPGCEPGIWFVLLALGAKERLKPALFSPATNRQLSAAPPRAHARTLELLSKKFQLRLLTISSQPAVFSPQRKTS